ncbi:MAG: hypothetical protein ACOYOE_11075 [Chlorobium sp.]
MPLLQVRDIPEELYNKLTQTAKADKRTIAQETIFLLRKALNFQEQRSAERMRLLEEIKRYKTNNVEKFPAAAELIIEDRER